MTIAIVIGFVVMLTLAFYCLKFVWFVIKWLFHWDQKDVKSNTKISTENDK